MRKKKLDTLYEKKLRQKIRREVWEDVKKLRFNKEETTRTQYQKGWNGCIDGVWGILSK